MIGELINGRYRIECEAGSGGMADVYKAHDLKTDRTVALKVIKKDYCRDSKYVRRFEREAQAVLSLKNANIVRAYDYGTYEKLYRYGVCERMHTERVSFRKEKA